MRCPVISTYLPIQHRYVQNYKYALKALLYVGHTQVCKPKQTKKNSNIHFNFLFQEKWHIAQEISHDFRISDALHCHHSLLFGNFSQSQTKQKKRTVAHEKQVSNVFKIMEFSLEKKPNLQSHVSFKASAGN